MSKNSQNQQPITQQEEKAESKALPYEVVKGWTAIPNSIYTIYLKHPEMNSTAIVVYGYLLRHYNDNFGYAFPPQLDLAINLGVSTDTIKKSVAKLKNVGLISTKYNMQYSNNQYYFHEPLESIEELIERFPEVVPHLEKLEERAQKMRDKADSDRERLAKSREVKSVG